MLKKMGNRLKNQKGFTLVELLAVIVILGIIAAIAVPSIGGIINKSRYDGAKADAIEAINAAKIYMSENGVPDDTGTIASSVLGDYLDDSSNWASFTITVEDGGQTIKFTAGTKLTGAKFNNTPEITGTVKEINDLKYAKPESDDE